MIHLKTTCDTRRTKKDGTHPIVFRITLNTKTRDIASGYSCNLADWDSHNNTIKPKTDVLVLMANRIHDQKITLLEKIRDFELRKPHVTNVQEVKNFLAGAKQGTVTVKSFWEQETRRMEQANRHGNARNYKSAMLGIEKYQSLKIPFTTVDYGWLTKLETKMIQNGLKTNSVAVYMRTLRSIFNNAINSDVTDANNYPFKRYKIKTGSSKPRVISIPELQKFFSHRPNKDHYAYNAWNYGMLIFLLRGINFADLALLTSDNLKNGRIIYHRRKTHKMYSVELLPDAKQILDEYHCENRKTLLPILTNEEFEAVSQLPYRIEQQRKTTNKWLNKIGKQLDLDEALTTYVFRYSHANACKKLGFSKDMISESLGHGYGLAVSSAYLENYDIELIDEMNKAVCSEVMKGE